MAAIMTVSIYKTAVSSLRDFSWVWAWSCLAAASSVVVNNFQLAHKQRRLKHVGWFFLTQLQISRKLACLNFNTKEIIQNITHKQFNVLSCFSHIVDVLETNVGSVDFFHWYSTDRYKPVVNKSQKFVTSKCYRQIIDMLHETHLVSFFRGYTVEYTVSIRYTMS